MAEFDVDHLVRACLEALAGDDPVDAIRKVVGRAVSDPAALRRAFPVPVDPADDGILHRSDDLSVFTALFPQGFATGLHEHTMTAVIGVWAGYEDNHLYRIEGDALSADEVRRVGVGEVIVLDPGIAHDVHAPNDTWCAALHVYLGDLIAVPRREWDAVDAAPHPLDGQSQEDRWLGAAVATGLVAG
jgi:predicted metal-dependent enzyme (double-stranded beta helix superfamily)